MKLRRHPGDVRVALCFVILTLAWGVIGLLWASAPVRTGFGGLGWYSDVAMIHVQFPSFLVNPTSVGAEGDDIFTTWLIAEINTRLALVAGSWLLVAAVLWVLARRSRRSEVRRITTWTPR